MSKKYSPAEIVKTITNTIKDVLNQHVIDKPVESTTALLLGQEPTHLDAAEHHATLAVAHFHNNNEELSKAHRELAVQHGAAAGIDVDAMFTYLYSQFDDIATLDAPFLPHYMDGKLAKARGFVVRQRKQVKTLDPSLQPHQKRPAPLSVTKKELSDDAQEFISKQIKRLMAEKGMDQKQATAVAYEYARQEGYAVPWTDIKADDAKKVEVNEELKKPCFKKHDVCDAVNMALLKHQLGVFEPIQKAGLGVKLPQPPKMPMPSVSSIQAPKMPEQIQPPLPKKPPMPAPSSAIKTEEEDGQKKYVYGTRSEKWHLVGPEDRDYAHAISQKEFKTLGHDKAKEKYLQPRAIKAEDEDDEKKKKERELNSKLDGKGKPEGDPKDAVLYKKGSK